MPVFSGLEARCRDESLLVYCTRAVQLVAGCNVAISGSLSQPTLSRAHRSVTGPSVLFSSAKIKIAVSLRVSLRSRNATDGRYLPLYAAEVHYLHQHLFKLMTGSRAFKLMTGGATAGTGGRHVSHGFESLSRTFPGPKITNSKHKFKTMPRCRLYNL